MFKNKTIRVPITLILIASALVIILTLASVREAGAVGGESSPNASVSLVSDTGSVFADGTSTATITLKPYHYECSDLNLSGNPTYSISSSVCSSGFGGVKATRSGVLPYNSGQDSFTINITASNGATLSKTNLPCCNNTTFTVRSSTAGATTIIPSWGNASGGASSFAYGELSGVSVTFTVPDVDEEDQTVAAQSQEPTPQPEPTQELAQDDLSEESIIEPEVETKKDKLPVTSLQLNNFEVADPLKSVDLSERNVTFSGVASPNAKLQITVFSDPILKNIEADENGGWSVTFEDLPAGNHHAEVAIINNDGTKSDSKKIATFNIADQKQGQENTSLSQDMSRNEGSLAVYVISGIVGLMVIVILIVSKGRPLQLIRHKVKH